jgi:xylulokinase
VNLRGAALLGGLALGRIDVDAIPDAVPITGTHDPDEGLRDLYDEKAAAFVDLYRSLRSVHRRLNAP